MSDGTTIEINQKVIWLAPERYSHRETSDLEVTVKKGNNEIDLPIENQSGLIRQTSGFWLFSDEMIHKSPRLRWSACRKL